ncbi:MAG TPA: S1 RNA-binding domain-containing protein [Bacteroidia bacterium]|jgi:hypothetical protein
MDKVVEAVLKYGLAPTFLLIIIALIVQDPSRAFKLKSLFLTPFFKAFNWFKRAYVANEVANNLNTFFAKELSGEPISVKINWVKSPEDPVFKNGNLIILMKREEDQTRNILTATKYALPKVVCPIFRHHIKPTYTSAIDLALLQKFAGKLGNHGKYVFRKYFLNPEVETDPDIIETLQKLIKIDNYGILTTIFLNELDYIGEGLYAESSMKDRSNELLKFINFLCTIAEREIGEEIELTNFSDAFKVSIILLAKHQVASKRGLIPYLRRLNKNLEKGADSIYIIAFPSAFNFLNKFIDVIDGNQRVTLEKVFKTRESLNQDNGISINIGCLRRNRVFTNESFVKKIEACEIKIGKHVQGTVVDCSTDEALISFLGVDGTIKKKECSWLSHLNCKDVLEVGETKEFIINKIDTASGLISLSLRFPDHDPWKTITIPKLHDNIELLITGYDNLNFTGIYQSYVEVTIPIYEISWHLMLNEEKDKLLNTTVNAKVIKVIPEDKIIDCSVRQLEIDPWPIIHETLKIGTEFNGKVYEVSEHFVRVKIDNDLTGKIPRESLILAGHEYANYRENLVIGQGIEVVVTKVFLSKRWIRLDLKRNLN